jgi:uncharacterized protein with von Willebrand factor type A (vWA) domain
MPEPDGALLDRLVGFGRVLRAAGLPVGTGRVLTFCRAATVLDPFDPVDLRLAARATLVSRPDDLARLDELFDRYFSVVPDVLLPAVGLTGEEGPAPVPGPREAADDEGVGLTAASWRGADAEEELEGESAIRIVASDVEILRSKDFAELSDDERRLVLDLVRRLIPSIPVRRSRRLRAAPVGRTFDMRRTLRRSLRTEGEPFRLAWRDRGHRRRPLVLLLDVSGSMAPYSRPMVEFAHAATRAGSKVEAFCFGTRLTRITRALRLRDPEEALDAVAEAVSDWEGGTRIGASLKELLDVWSTRSSLRGAMVILCSDGLERGDPELLRAQMARLARLAHAVVWVNPLKGSPRYEPLARGMAASLPYVDRFLAGHNLESLEALAGTLTRG